MHPCPRVPPHIPAYGWVTLYYAASIRTLCLGVVDIARHWHVTRHGAIKRTLQYESRRDSRLSPRKEKIQT